MGFKEGGLRGSLRNVSVGAVEIPDSGLVHRYDASSLSLSDGNTVSTFTDTQGSADLSATGAPTYQSGALNGNDAVVYDGVGDSHYGPLTSTLTQPNTVAMAFQLNSVDGNQQIIVGGDDGSGRSSHNSDVESGSWLMFAGDVISGGSEDTLSHCRVDLYDGTSSVLDLDNTQIVSGDAGTRQISNVALAAATSAVAFADLTIGEVLIYDTAKTNGERAEIYNYLSSKWGV